MSQQQQTNFALFMPYLGPNVSRRARELQLAEVRAAAARSTHMPQRIASQQPVHRSRSPTTPIEHSERFPTPSAAEIRKFGEEVRSNSKQTLLHTSEDDRALVQYYIQNLLPETFNLSAVIGVSTLRHTLFMWLLQDADFYAIGIAYLSVKVGDYAENYGRDLSLLRYEFIGRGILRLRQRIERSSGFADHTTLMATAYLAEIASLEADEEAYRIHKTSLDNMIHLRGGMDESKLGSVVKCAVAQMREDWELRDLNMKPGMSDVRTSSTDWQLEMSQNDASRGLPRLTAAGFHNVCAVTKLSGSCIMLIQRITSANSDIFSNVQDPAEGCAGEFMTFDELAPSVTAMVRNPYLNTFEQLLSTALLLYVSIQFCQLRNQPLSLIKDKYASFRKSLTIALGSIQLSELKQFTVPLVSARIIEHSLVWIFCIAAGSWVVDQSEPRAEAVQLFARLKELMPTLMHFEDLVPSLNDHCTTDFLSASLEVCWLALEMKDELERAD